MLLTLLLDPHYGLTDKVILLVFGSLLLSLLAALFMLRCALRLLRRDVPIVWAVLVLVGAVALPLLTWYWLDHL